MEDGLLEEWAPSSLHSCPFRVSNYLQQGQSLGNIKYEKMTESSIDDKKLKEGTNAVVNRYETRYLGCIIEFVIT